MSHGRTPHTLKLTKLSQCVRFQWMLWNLFTDWMSDTSRESLNDECFAKKKKASKRCSKDEMIKNISQIWLASFQNVKIFVLNKFQHSAVNISQGSHSGSRSQKFLFLSTVYIGFVDFFKGGQWKNALTLCHCAGVLFLVSSEPRCGLLCILTARRLFS